MSDVRCLSVKQPWASLIAMGGKTIELRTWRVAYRGPLVIVASVNAARLDHLMRWGDGPRGVALAIVDLVDVRPATPADARGACCTPDERELAWVLENPRLLPNVKVRGQLRLYPPPPELLAVLEA